MLSTAEATAPIPSAFWGRWCAFDLSGCPLHLLTDSAHIERYIEAICNGLGFKRFGNPIIVRFGERPEVSGFTFVQMIETSLISGHFAESSNSAFIDIFSCAMFSPEDAEQITAQFFCPTACKRHLVDRFTA